MPSKKKTPPAEFKIPDGFAPVPPVESDNGSQVPLPFAQLTNPTTFMLFDSTLGDDGGVRDLSLILDLEDHFLRRQKGDALYFDHLKKDCLPRDKKLGILTDIHKHLPEGAARPTTTVSNVPVKALFRKQQKSKLAEILYVESPLDDERGGSEIFSLPPLPVPPEELSPWEHQKRLYRHDKLKSLCEAVQLALSLQDLGCISLALSELAKRRLLYDAFPGGPSKAAEAGNRACDLAIAVVGDGVWDRDLVARESRDNLNFVRDEESAMLESRLPDPENSEPALRSEKLKPFTNERLAMMCKRAALLQKGNCLTVLGRFSEARACYEEMHTFLLREERCLRVDWELLSARVNVGHCLHYAGQEEEAIKMYDTALAIGEDHREGKHPGGQKFQGMIMRMAVNKAKIQVFKVTGDKAAAAVTTAMNVEDGSALQKQMAIEKEMQRQQFLEQQARKKAQADALMQAKAAARGGKNKGDKKAIGGVSVDANEPPNPPGSPKKGGVSAAVPQSPKRESEGGDWVDVDSA